MISVHFVITFFLYHNHKCAIVFIRTVLSVGSVQAGGGHGSEYILSRQIQQMILVHTECVQCVFEHTTKYQMAAVTNT